MQQQTPDELQLFNFALFPNEHQPSGDWNHVSRLAEFKIIYTPSFAPGNGKMTKGAVKKINY